MRSSGVIAYRRGWTKFRGPPIICKYFSAGTMHTEFSLADSAVTSKDIVSNDALYSVISAKPYGVKLRVVCRAIHVGLFMVFFVIWLFLTE